MSDNPLLKTPGELINEARRAQDLTIAQLSERTKIPPPVLTALELDEYHKISGPLYIKSFLRTCAMDLGLDPETVLSLYNKFSGEKKSGPEGNEMVWTEDQVQVSHVGLPWIRIILAAGVVVTLVGAGLFIMRGCGQEKEMPASEVTSSVIPDSPADLLPGQVPNDVVRQEPADHETLMAADTEEILRQRAAVNQDMEFGGSEPAQTKFSPDDTLALGWQESPPPVVKRKESVPKPVPEEVVPVQADTVAVAPIQPMDKPPVVVETTADKIELPAPKPTPVFVEQMDSAWPVVLRIVCAAPQDILVKRDGEAAFQRVLWPGDQETAPVVPEAGFEAGRAYRADGQFMVFWGAEDHFSLKLARVRGVEVSINGRVRDIGRLRPGQEIILDAHDADSAERR